MEGQMSVRKRKWSTRLGERKEAWIVDYADGQGDRHIETFAKKKDADAYHDKVRVDVRQGMHTAPSKAATVAEAAREWIKRVEANGMRGDGPAERSTVRQYRQHVDLHINPRLGHVNIAKLTHVRVEAFRDELLEALSRPLARKVLTSLKSILKAAKHGHVADDVTIGDSKRNRRKIEAGRDFPTPEEIKRLINAAPDLKRRTLLLMASLAGLRASELRGLRWSDVDLKSAELNVRQRADRFGDIGAPKSHTSVRTIPLAPDLVGGLKEWKLACPKGEAGLVFPTSTGAIEHHKNMLRGLETVMLAARVVDKDGRPKYAMHAFRHFFASWCINPKDRGGRGLATKEVQELLGHSSIVLTMDVYGHMFPRRDDRKELAEATAALLG
jgi:integrase